MVSRRTRTRVRRCLVLIRRCLWSLLTSPRPVLRRVRPVRLSLLTWVVILVLRAAPVARSRATSDIRRTVTFIRIVSSRSFLTLMAR